MRRPIDDPELYRAWEQRSETLLQQALTAVLTDGLDEWRKDPRDLMMALAPYHDCARRLGFDPAEVFERAAANGPGDLLELVRDFGARSDITEETFQYRFEDGRYFYDDSW